MATETKKTQATIVTLRSRAQMRATEEFINGFNEEKANQLAERLSNLEAVWKAYEAAQLKLESYEEDDKLLNELFDARNAFYDRYCSAKGFLTSRKTMAVSDLDVTDTGKGTNLANLRLPKLDLPTFDGNTTDWLSFKDRFVSMIDEAEDMPSVMKLQYLLSVLKGEVSKRFQHVQLTADNYSITWQALLDRYDNKRALKREYFKALHAILPMKGESTEELRRVFDEFTRLTQGMSALKEPIGQWDTPLCNLLFYKLDGRTLLAWEEYTSKDQEDLYTKLQEFLQRRLRILSATVQSTYEVSRSSVGKVAGVKQHKGIVCVSTVPPAILRCYACAQQHYLHQCEMFKGMQVAQREEVITSNKLCRNCFRVGHIALRCNSKFKCHKCHQRHHTLLHVDPIVQNPSPDNIVVANTAASGNTIVLLQTALVQVIDDNGRMFDARALLDSGSMSNFISTALANRLTNRKCSASVSILGIGQRENHIHEAVDVIVASKTQQFSTKLNFLILDSPTAQLPTMEVNTNEWKIEGLVLADPFFYKPGQIDLLIGGEAFWAIHMNERIGVGSDKPVFVNTKFGWTVAGSTSATSQNRHVSTNAVVRQDTLESTIRRFWEIDALPSSSSASDEDPCETFFSETTSRNNEGRLVVRLPKVKTSRISLGESKSIAQRRFFNTERRLQKNPEVYEQYRMFLKQYEELGHMELLAEPVDDSMVHCYLPHHPVLKESSSTTKVRVVFDASCKTTSGYSLNDALQVGPTVQVDLFSLIVHFRTHRIAISADVEKMYRQVMVHVDDQPLQRIVWRPSAAEELRSYQLKTVTYGTASAPFLATRALKQIALNAADKYPIEAHAITNNFYVDDFLSGANDEESAATLQKNVSNLLQQYGFVLRKWASNSKRVLDDIADEDLATPRCHNLGTDPAITTLGLVWFPGSDNFSYNFKNVALPPTITKRTLLSAVAKIFDPLGLVGPVVCKAKLLMQQAWTSIDPITGKPIDWDVNLPTKLQHAWKAFQQTIHIVENLNIPRYVFGNAGLDKCEFHIFGDASEKAYGSCCYIRAPSESGVSIHLLVAKSKLAPVKTHHSIAKLELCAALLSVQLYDKISTALRFNPTKIIFWSDSTTVLHWLNASPCRWKTFVANRTTQILDATNINQWKHIAGIDNPADYISRGLDPTDLLDAERWWFGPSWLSLPQDQWPAGHFTPCENADILEERRNTTMLALAAVAATFSDELFAKYSSYTKLRRVFAYCCRLLVKTKHRKGAKVCVEFPEDTNPKWLSTAELHLAEVNLCLLHQQQMFPDELHALTNGSFISRSSQLRWVNPVLGKDGLIRVGGRLNLANLPLCTKNPIVLSAKHRLTVMLVEACHKRQLHAGPQQMLASLRQRFWIIGARNLIRSVYHRCVTCFKKHPTFITQTIADLPSSRVVPAPPFSISGVDYCGPFYVKFGTRKTIPRKVYLSIFVCFATRAVHIEVVSDLTTQAFIAALQRFISRRGRVKELHSDNGTAFKGAANLLHQLYVQLKTDPKSREIIFNWCAVNEITWKFIPPRAPHFGGLWEAAVKSAKQHLLKELGSSTLLYDDFLTLCARVEMCLNSRPLTPIPNSPDDLDVLTPGHFITGSNFQMVPEVDVKHIPDNRLTHWGHTQKLMQSIWARWYPEYLQQLQARATKKFRMQYPAQSKRMKLYRDIENRLKEELVGKTINRPEPLENDVRKELLDDLIPPFYTPFKAKLDALSAIQLLNRYCMSMPRDLFTGSNVTWERIDRSPTEIIVTVKLPLQSTVREVIHGQTMKNLKLAKQSAAFNACKRLFEVGELNMYLLPIATKDKVEELSEQYFKHWRKMSDEPNPKQAGTMKYVRGHKIVYPEETVGCTPQADGEQCYVYIVRMRAHFDANTHLENVRIFQELYSSANNFGILTRKRLPRLARMKLFVTLGAIGVEIVPEPVCITLAPDSGELQRLKRFHLLLFRDLLKVWKPFTVLDALPEENGFLIVPMLRSQSIDWELVSKFPYLRPAAETSTRARQHLRFETEQYLLRVVHPWYKNDPDQNYVVVRVRDDLRPTSPFPNAKYDSYEQYFAQEHHQVVVRHEDQFLIEVKGITTSLNRLHPGAEADGGASTRSRYWEFQEILIPELVHNFEFPADYWLKATLLPSALHRVHYLLLAEGIRVDLARNAQVGSEHCERVEDVIIDRVLSIEHQKSTALYGGEDDDDEEDEDEDEEEKDSDEEGARSMQVACRPAVDPKQPSGKQLLQVLNQIHSDSISLADRVQYPWEENEQPKDLERNWDTVSKIDIDYYASFVKKYEQQAVTIVTNVNRSVTETNIDRMLANLNMNKNEAEASPVKALPALEDGHGPVAQIAMLRLTMDNTANVALQQSDLLQALTTKSSADVFNLERFEVLGDAFLKFAVSVYILFRHTSWHEGYLTTCKGRMVSNRNLLYCAMGYGLPGKIKAHPFDPKNDWVPPLSTVPGAVRRAMVDANESPALLYNLKLTEEEIQSGVVAQATVDKFLPLIEQAPAPSQSTLHTVLQQVQIRDKVVADVTEALLGVCVKTVGYERSFRFLSHLGIIPKGADVPMLLRTTTFPIGDYFPVRHKVDQLLCNPERIEATLGYRFRNRTYLLQAFTHTSYMSNSLTGSYQQLEFLGDAVLDFLVSMYIYERNPSMSPGQLTDLRSALVNNVNLACVLVRNELHRHILSQSPMLTDAIGKFVAVHRCHRNQGSNWVRLLTEESDTPMAEYVDVPKVLGDVLEALIGAIYLDSGNDLVATWEVCFRLLRDEIADFTRKTPIQVVRQLYEHPEASPHFSAPFVEEEVVYVKLSYTHRSQRQTVYGFGKNKDDAKRAAAKIALSKIM